MVSRSVKSAPWLSTVFFFIISLLLMQGKATMTHCSFACQEHIPALTLWKQDFIRGSFRFLSFILQTYRIDAHLLFTFINHKCSGIYFMINMCCILRKKHRTEINQSCERKCHYIKLNIHKSLNKTAINSCIKYNILARKLNTYDTLCLTQLITINVLRGWKQATGTCTLHHCTGIKCH